MSKMAKCPRMQLFLRVVQVGLHLQLGVDAFAFSLLLRVERFLCLSARFEELRAQTLDEHEGVVEQSSPVVERMRYNTAAAEENVRFVVAGTCFKRCR